MKARILVTDDEPAILKLIIKVLEKDEYICHSAQTVSDAKKLLNENRFDLLITDLVMPDESGLALLDHAAKFHPQTGRIMITGFNTDEASKRALQLGVYGYLLKPLVPDMILITVRNALQHMQLEHNMQESIRNAQKELLEKNLTLEGILENIDVGVVVLDKEMRILNFNHSMELIFPEFHSSKGQLCHKLMTYNRETHFCDSCPMKKAFEQKKTVQTELILEQKEGIKELRISAIPILDKNNNITKGMVFYHDVTDIMASQRTAYESNKLAAVGQLAAGIAHEINTPSQFVGDNVQYMKDVFHDLQPIFTIVKSIQDNRPEDITNKTELLEKLKTSADKADLQFLLEDIPNAIEQSIQGITRITDIVRAMKEFSHPGEREKTPSDINELIRSTLTVCKNEWKYVAKTFLHFDETIDPVYCLASEINQVILILIVNSAHAIDEKISCTNESMGEIHITTNQINANSVEIRIRDTGNGIPENIRAQVFEAFFTTKKRGKGTGQGLSMAKNIITEKHQGSITLNSTPGEGTEFIITLPNKEPGKGTK